MTNASANATKEVEELKATLAELYKQQANEKTQFQLTIQQQRLELDQLTQDAEELRLANGMWQEQFQSWESTRADQEAQRAAQEAQRAAQEAQIALLQVNIKQSSNELVGSLEELDKLKQANSQLTQQLQEASRHVDATNQQSDDFYEEKQQLLGEKTKLEAQIIKLQSQNESLQTQLNVTSQDMSAMSTNANARAKKLEVVVAEKQEQIEQLQNTTSKLQDQLDFLASSGVRPATTEKYAGVDATGSNWTTALMNLRTELLTQSRELVEQAEKNVLLANRYDQTKESLAQARKEMASAREFLLKGIMHSDQVDSSNYQHIALEELVRLRLKAFEHEVAVLNGSGSTDANARPSLSHEDDNTSAESEPDKTHLDNVDRFSIDELGAVGRMEKEMRSLRNRNKRLQLRSDNLEKELEKASTELSELNNLKQKALEFALREKSEKELRIQNETEKKQNAEKIQQLSTHIEKLMVHLKHEASSKTKVSDEKKRLERELAELKVKNAMLAKTNCSKDKQIEEISQGSKILQDQLRLMDEKFIEVRNKLDYTRASSQKEMKRIQNELNTLRMKWQMASDAGLLNSMPDYSLIAKYSKRSAPLGASLSESHLRTEKSTSSHVGDSNQTSGNAPKVRFEIPKLPQKATDNDMPWSDEKLSTLQKQLHHKQQSQ